MSMMSAMVVQSAEAMATSGDGTCLELKSATTYMLKQINKSSRSKKR